MYKSQVIFYSKFSQFNKYLIPIFSDPRLCTYIQNISFSQCVGKKTLIFGESNVGKSEITSIFLNFLRNQPKIKKIYVFDMAPERFQTQRATIGGKLTDYDSSFQYDSKTEAFTYSIIPPRSKSANQKEVYKNCIRNYEQIFKDFIENTKVVVGRLLTKLGEVYLS